MGIELGIEVRDETLITRRKDLKGSRFQKAYVGGNPVTLVLYIWLNSSFNDSIWKF
jgi:hypothetical protein